MRDALRGAVARVAGAPAIDRLAAEWSERSMAPAGRDGWAKVLGTDPGNHAARATGAPQGRGHEAVPGQRRSEAVTVVQRRSANRGLPRLPAARANPTGLPDALKVGAERLSGLSLDDVRVHRDSPEPARLGALAFTRGTDIHVGPGQERHLAHETWHVVQQMQGRVGARTRVAGEQLNDDARLEQEADVMGARASVALDGHRDASCAGYTGRPASPPPSGSVVQPKLDPPNLQTKKAVNRLKDMIMASWRDEGKNVRTAEEAADHLVHKGDWITLNEAETIAQSDRVSFEAFEGFKNRLRDLAQRIGAGATVGALKAEVRARGMHLTFDNYTKMRTDFPRSVRLEWSTWFPYTKKNTLSSPTQDAEVSVMAGLSQWGVVHVHYEVDETPAEEYITAIHLKPYSDSDTRYKISDPTTISEVQAIVEQHLGERPAT